MRKFLDVKLICQLDSSRIFLDTVFFVMYCRYETHCFKIVPFFRRASLSPLRREKGVKNAPFVFSPVILPRKPGENVIRSLAKFCKDLMMTSKLCIIFYPRQAESSSKMLLVTRFVFFSGMKFQPLPHLNSYVQVPSRGSDSPSLWRLKM